MLCRGHQLGARRPHASSADKTSSPKAIPEHRQSASTQPVRLTVILDTFASAQRNHFRSARGRRVYYLTVAAGPLIRYTSGDSRAAGDQTGEVDVGEYRLLTLLSRKVEHPGIADCERCSQRKIPDSSSAAHLNFLHVYIE